mgnify:CR=1 FL=1
MQYDDAEPFQDGVAAIELSEKWGYLNKQGGHIWKPTK